MKGYTKSQIDRIGNAIIFFAERIPCLSKTRLLKLLYLTEEISVKIYHRPLFYVDFNVWKLGPVVRDVFADLSADEDEITMFSSYIRVEPKKSMRLIKAKKAFSDNEFSDNDIELLENIVRTYGKFNADTLVEITHKEDGLWYKFAQQNGLLEEFDLGLSNSSDVVIDLSELLAGCDKEYYHECIEAHNFEKLYN